MAHTGFTRNFYKVPTGNSAASTASATGINHGTPAVHSGRTETDTETALPLALGAK